jgi:hypothetical protein
MDGSGLDFSDIKFGETNRIKENDSNPSADRRRTDTTTTIRLSSERAFAKDTLENRNTFNGYVINARMVTVPLAEDPTKLAQLKAKVPYEMEDDNAAAAASWLYKVYIPELSPLQPPKSATDSVIQHYPDITLWSGGTIGSPDLPYGTQVVVRFADLGNMAGGTIEAIAHMGNPMAQADPCGQGLQAAYNNGTPTTVGSAWGDDPHERRMMDEAKRLKLIRQQIFEDSSDTWKVARGGETGPFSKKGRKSWTSNAILSSADQTALKKKFQTKINQVAANIGMEVKTLEKIFKKESGTFDPYAINNNTSATGLIQFMPEFSKAGTAGSLGTTVEELLTMGPDKQLDYVEKYFKKGKRSSANWEEVDWYFIVFYPKAIGKPDSYVIGNANTAKVNPGYAERFGYDNAGLITRRRVKARWYGTEK